MKILHALGLAALSCACLMFGGRAAAQQVVSENFNGTSTNNQWYSFNGACLTAGANSVGSLNIPACKNLTSYYGNTIVTDINGSGALRLTDNSYYKSGMIVSVNPFSSSQGVQITFTTYSFGGDRGGSASDGADGMGFYLIDGSYASAIQQSYSLTTTANTTCGSSSNPQTCSFNSATNLPWYIGSFGGSLGYSCSNNGSNSPFNGMTGAYLGLGMDEYGNFLNTADNTASGWANTGQYGGSGNAQPSRIGLRGQGNINIASLTALAQANGALTMPTAADVQATCQNGYYAITTQAATYGYQYTYSKSGNTQNYSGTLYQKGNNNSYTAKGATTAATSTDQNFSDGYTGSGTPYGKVGNSYYSISIASYTATAAVTKNISVADYAAIPGAYTTLANKIANESVSTLASATPIQYSLIITQNGLLTLQYSYNGGNYIPVLTNASITSSNGTIPASYIFGFGGSTGGSENNHEITCFQASPASVSASSAALNVETTQQVETGSQIYLAYYHSNNWWGQVEAYGLSVAADGTVSLTTNPAWDASCTLTGGACASTGQTLTAPGTNSSTPARTLLTSTAFGAGNGVNISNNAINSGSASTSASTTAFNLLSSTEQTALSYKDAASTSSTTSSALGAARLAYLSGDRSNEYPNGYGFRARTSVLGDVMDSSPVLVGAPNSSYPDSWADRLYSSATAPENTSAYSAFESRNATRLNVVYEGSNDGFLHGFEAGSFNKDGSFNTTGNDGREVMGYLPEEVISSIANWQNSGIADFTSPSYGHNFFVDATPGTGDLFYNGSWHTWLASGLGAGGNSIFVLDITTPTSFSATNVIGEWDNTNIKCTVSSVTTGGITTTGTSATCANNLGQTFGTPQIRRLHNGEWGIIFGNGFNSTSGDAGIFIMTFAYSSSGTPNVQADNIYYLSTGVSASNAPTGVSGVNGIAYVTPVDLDGDHITDYVYAGDMYGNLWRFDLTSNKALSWAVTKYPNTTNGALFSTPITQYSSGTGSNTTYTYSWQPITTQVLALSVAANSLGSPRIMVEFGTGSVTQTTNSTAITYASGQQAMYGIWDWSLGGAAPGSAYLGVANPKTPILVTPTNSTSPTLLQQTTSTIGELTATNVVAAYRTVSNNTICFAGTTCNDGSAGTDYGWYMNLPGFTGVSGIAQNTQTEQIIYNPVEQDGALIFDTTTPANNSLLTCTNNTVSGWTMALDPSDGGQFAQSFFTTSTGNTTYIGGVQLSATGSAALVSTTNASGQTVTSLVAQTANGAGAAGSALKVVPPSSYSGQRVTWIQLH